MASIIRVQNLVKKYGTFTAVADISFSVEAGEIFAFLGPNGAGKTTTIKILTTLLKPTSGQVEIDGLDPAHHQNEVRERFGIVFQDPSLDDELTAYENMDIHGALYRVPRRVRSTRIEMLLKLFELWDRRGDRAKTFSGGMRRRLEIARGMLHTPKILFLDEPTLGLDPQTRNHLSAHVAQAECRGTRHGVSHHTLHGRGRPGRRSHCHHRSWPNRGPRIARRTQTADGFRDSGTGLSRADRLVHSGRGGQSDGPHAQYRPLVETLIRGRYLCFVAAPGETLRALPARIIGSLGQPLLFLIGLGFGLGPVFQKAGQGNYIQFLAPGVIAMTVLFTSVFSGIELIWDRQFGFLKETLVAPVSRLTIMIGRVLGGATVAVGQGLIVCAFCLAAGFRFSGLAAAPMSLLFMALIAVLFTALGTAIASAMTDFQGFQLVMNFLVMPTFFLSGALFPLRTRLGSCR